MVYGLNVQLTDFPIENKNKIVLRVYLIHWIGQNAGC